MQEENKVKLFEHQKKALQLTEGLNKVAYYLDMGLGKTFVATEKAITFKEDLIVLVCQKSKLKDWKEHFESFYPKFNAVIYKKEMESIPPNTVLIINYDSVWKRKQFEKLKNYTLILDESSYIKNPKSNRTKFILKMKPSNVILLSGTPTGGKYEELLPQIKLLGWNITKKEYWNRYIEYFDMKNRGIPFPVITGYKNVDDLKENLREHGAVFMKTEEVITLPDTVHYKIHVPTIKEYKTFLKDRVIVIDDEELVGDNSLTKLLRLRELSSTYNKHKREKLKELLESTYDRVIIFYSFKEEMKIIKAICDDLKKPISIVNGETRDLNNYECLENTVTLIQYQAGAMGLNLQKSNKIIYYSPTLSSELFEQSKKRTHRLGQNKTCMYYYLITQNSIEEKIYKVLEQRKDYTDKLFTED